MDVAVGDSHTLALSSKGEVYSFGRGDGSHFGLVFYDDITPLGIESSLPADAPQIVSGLAGKQVTAIAAGPDYSYAVCKSGEVYCWGQGSEGVFCDEGTSRRYPALNEALEALRKEKGIAVQCIKTADRQLFALMSNGQLYSWGNNLSGNLGTKKNHLVIGDKYTLTPKLVTPEKISQFDVGTNTLVFLTGTLPSNEL